MNNLEKFQTDLSKIKLEKIIRILWYNKETDEGEVFYMLKKYPQSARIISIENNTNGLSDGKLWNTSLSKRLRSFAVEKKMERIDKWIKYTYPINTFVDTRVYDYKDFNNLVANWTICPV